MTNTEEFKKGLLFYIDPLFWPYKIIKSVTGSKQIAVFILILFSMLIISNFIYIDGKSLYKISVPIIAMLGIPFVGGFLFLYFNETKKFNEHKSMALSFLFSMIIFMVAVYTTM
jgi:hypothetical protein